MTDKDIVLPKVYIDESAEEYREVVVNLSGGGDAMVYADPDGDFKKFNRVLVSDGEPGSVTFNCEVAINDRIILSNLGATMVGDLLAVSTNEVKRVTSGPPVQDLPVWGNASDPEARAAINAILSSLRRIKLIAV